MKPRLLGRLVTETVRLFQRATTPRSRTVAVDSTGFARAPAEPLLPAAGRQTLPSPELAAVGGGGVDRRPWCCVGRWPTVERAGTRWNFALGGTNASPPALHAPAGRWGDDSEANHRWLREDLGLESIIPPVTGRLSRGMTTRPYRRQLQLAFPRKVYDQRWRVETLISVVKRRFGGAVTDRRYWQQVKQTLLRGIAYNLYRAAVIHLHLVCFAFALLTHLRLEQTGAQGQRKRDNAANWPTTTAQDQLQRLVWDDLMASLKENHHDEFIVAELTRLRVA